jgi:hypothetical protein
MSLNPNYRKRYTQKGGRVCRPGFTEDKILNDCIKYDYGDNGLTNKRNQIFDIVASIKDKQKKGEPLGEIDPNTKNAYLCLTGFDLDKNTTDPINGDDIADACQATGIYDMDVPSGNNSRFTRCMAGNAGHNERAVIRRYKGEAIRTKNQYVTETDRSQRYDEKGNTLVYNYCKTRDFADPILKQRRNLPEPELQQTRNIGDPILQRKINACKLKNGTLDTQQVCRDKEGYQLGGKRRVAKKSSKKPSKKSSKRHLAGGKRKVSKKSSKKSRK